MNRQPQIDKLYASRRRRRESRRPRGVIVVVTGFCLVAVFAFVALSVDTSRMALTETRMQNAVDAAALAAAEEITAAVFSGGADGGAQDSSAVVAAARQMAADVAEANGVFIDKDSDVKFGKRSYHAASGEWPIVWGAQPYNVVRVEARKTNVDVTAPDGELPLAFGWAVGRSQVPLRAAATAFVEARDLVIVLDFSGSMNYDSQLSSSLGVSAAEGILDDMWNTMVQADPKWPNTETSKFPSDGFGEIDSYQGKYLSSSDTATIRSQLGLTINESGSRKYPYPQAGRYSDGSPKSKPSNSSSDALWGRYIDYVKNHPVSSYRKHYGYRTLMDFLQQKKQSSGFEPRSRYTSEDMWRTPHQPMDAVKNGASLFLDVLTELDFGDEVGLVGYGEWAEQITGLDDGVVAIDVSGDPITADYNQIDNLQRHHQAGEFNGQTAMGDGIKQGAALLLGPNGYDGHARLGARPTMLLMTDGITNQRPSGWSLPSSFRWSDWTDFDGDGDSDYSTSDNEKRYAFWEATKAIEKGVTIHALAVGNDADTDLMEAIAFASGGLFISVPGNGVEDMEAEVLEAFAKIAGKLPPAKLVFDQ